MQLNSFKSGSLAINTAVTPVAKVEYTAWEKYVLMSAKGFKNGSLTINTAVTPITTVDYLSYYPKINLKAFKSGSLVINTAVTPITTIYFIGKTELVFDRTIEDVQNKTEKGFLSFWDMQKVENFIKKLADRMNIRGYQAIVNAKSEYYYIGYLPRKLADFERIRQNIIEIRKHLNGYPETPQTPQSLDFLNYVKANNIEKILFDIGTQLKAIEESDRYCGIIMCGDEFEF